MNNTKSELIMTQLKIKNYDWVYTKFWIVFFPLACSRSSKEAIVIVWLNVRNVYRNIWCLFRVRRRNRAQIM